MSTQSSSVPAASATPEPSAKPPEAGNLRSVHTQSLTQVLEQLKGSLLVSTYQAGKLIVARVQDGRVNTHFRNFVQPMGLACDGARLAIGTKREVLEYRNQPDVGKKLEPVGKHDACFLPRRSHVTGDIRIHEIGWAGRELWGVNTRFSCLVTLENDFSFVPRWRPKFITGYSSDDRCHLNGMCIVDGKPTYVTALGETDTAGGWRENKATGGILMDVASNEIIARGLCMPHSPRLYQGKLWVLESGAGQLCTVDLKTGKRDVIATLPGFTRGLDFAGPLAFIGLSQVRETATFGGLPITDPSRERSCGVWVVDIRNGQTVGFLRFEEGVQEIFALQFLAGLRFPEILTDDERIDHSFVLPDDALKLVQARPAPTA